MKHQNIVLQERLAKQQTARSAEEEAKSKEQDAKRKEEEAKIKGSKSGIQALPQSEAQNLRKKVQEIQGLDPVQKAKALKKLYIQYHPDKCGDDEDKRVVHHKVFVHLKDTV